VRKSQGRKRQSKLRTLPKNGGHCKLSLFKKGILTAIHAHFLQKKKQILIKEACFKREFNLNFSLYASVLL
jgi:hypothetical protein